MDPEPSNTAAARAYAIAEVRQCFLSYLAPSDLATCMRLEKRGVYAVSKELYRSVSYQFAQSSMHKSTARTRQYCKQVVEIDARDVLLPHATQLKLPKQRRSFDISPYDDNSDNWTESESENEHHYGKHNDVQKYTPDTFQLLVPPLRKKFPQLRRIIFGAKHPESDVDQWVVHLSQRQVGESAGGQRQAAQSVGGRIDLTRTAKFYLTQLPPTSLHIPPAPSKDYVLEQRINIQLRPPRYPDGDLFFEEWLVALQELPAYASIGTLIDLGWLPITLGAISGMYERQIATDTGGRLQHILALSSTPWDVKDFQSFSKLASSSILDLYLSQSYNPLGESCGIPKLSFDDLPEFVSIVRQNLPNLVSLQLSMSGVETAEKTCSGLLSDTLLESGGTLAHLVIFTAQCDTSLFNVIRCLSPLCTPTAEIAVVTRAADDWGYGPTQQELHSYLRRQSPERRRHLATVDFASLDVNFPCDVKHLTHDDEGRPLSRGVVRGREWSVVAEALTSSSATILPTFQAALTKYARLATAFDSKSSTTTSAERQQLALELAEVAGNLSALAEEVQATASRCVEGAADVGAFVKSLSENSGKRRYLWGIHDSDSKV